MFSARFPFWKSPCAGIEYWVCVGGVCGCVCLPWVWRMSFQMAFHFSDPVLHWGHSRQMKSLLVNPSETFSSIHPFRSALPWQAETVLKAGVKWVGGFHLLLVGWCLVYATITTHPFYGKCSQAFQDWLWGTCLTCPHCLEGNPFRVESIELQGRSPWSSHFNKRLMVPSC